MCNVDAVLQGAVCARDIVMVPKHANHRARPELVEGWGAGFDRLSLSAEEAPKVGLSYKARISGA